MTAECAPHLLVLAKPRESEQADVVVDNIASTFVRFLVEPKLGVEVAFALDRLFVGSQQCDERGFELRTTQVAPVSLADEGEIRSAVDAHFQWLSVDEHCANNTIVTVGIFQHRVDCGVLA